MKIYLVQHGEAVAKDIDPDRPLSEQGREDVGRVASVVVKAGAGIFQILHSGKTRARQTAEIMAATAAPSAIVDYLPGLAPKDPVEPLLQHIGQWTEDTLLVGHQPFMGKLVSALLNCTTGAEILAYRPGTLVCLEDGQAGDWRLLWVLRPELFGG